MCATKSKNNEIEPEVLTKEEKQKTCFAIMPIADHPDYPNGHFTRVYNHLIKPACEQAGYKVIRADDAKASHMIMFDILKNIVECDMAICDLSSKNANVFYELGLRQAFNKKTILITDSITNTPFDITGFRYVKYSESLRVDTVISDVREITAMLKTTDSASEDDINSIVNLLKVQPAQINKVQLNEQESVVYELIKNLDSKVSSLINGTRNNKNDPTDYRAYILEQSSQKGFGMITGMSFDKVRNKFPELLGKTIFKQYDLVLGRFIEINEAGFLVFHTESDEYQVSNTLSDRESIRAL